MSIAPPKGIYKKAGFYLVLGSFLTLGIFVFSLHGFAAWTNPTGNPPANNVPEPINAGTAFQTKLGTFKLGTTTSANIANLFVYNGRMAVATSTLRTRLIVGDPSGPNANVVDIDGNRIVGLSTVPINNNEAASKYYVDNAVTATSFWADRGSNNISNTNTGNVGIGVINPNNLLQVFDLINFDNTESNTKVGYQAGRNTVAGARYNTYLGYRAGMSAAAGGSASADNNIAIGQQAFFNNRSGSMNIVIGNYALLENTSGVSNIAIGFASAYSNTTGNDNISIGAANFLGNTTGYGNIAIGTRSLTTNSVGSANVAIGYETLRMSTTGFNVALGTFALASSTTGNNNVALGYRAGLCQADGITGLNTANNSVYIGNGAKGFNNSDSNSIVIGNNATGIGANSVVLGNDSITKTALKGNVGIGTTNPTYGKLEADSSNGTLIAANVTSGYGDISLLAGGTNRITFGYAGSAGNYGAQTAAGDVSIKANNTNIHFVTGVGNANTTMYVSSAGRVGIGTINPSVALEVVGDIKVSGTITAGPGDLAEEFFTDRAYPAGTVLVMDDEGYKSATACTEKYDKKVIGVISEEPGLIIGKIEGKYKAQVALVGVVKVKINVSGGKITKGDLLTTSAVAGEAMRADESKIGTIIGKALEGDSGKGYVMALVNLK